MAKNKPAPQPYAKPDQIQIRGNQIFSLLRQKWIPLTPEEMVRQQYLQVLVEEYGFSHEQIAEEMEVTGRGSAQARADFVIWRTAQDKTAEKSPLIVVECKADNVTIDRTVYAQGENYARLTNAPFFVTHNHRETRYWRVLHEKMPKHVEEIDGIPHADATDKEIKELIERLKVFKEDEFADLLHLCHNVIRNREKRDPVAAFDEIAKILFLKVFVERELKTKKKRKNLFSEEFLKDQIGNNPLEELFQKTKEHYKADRIFESDEKLNLKPATGLEIVRLLEKYNLSDTSEDIKGIAFERFLGKTFRGEIGQFFTPRPIVEFMVRMVDPKEGEVICDPASGSGGFLIRFFEIVRQQILGDADRQYQEYKAKIEGDKNLSPEKKATMLRARFDEIQPTLDHDREGSRLWTLANRCIYGTDANDRMARTSKMNMIMHGDGHGGVHHHDGFLNVNGIFEGRFDIILTNPPFGANVEPSDKILEEQVTLPDEVEREYGRIYGTPYKEALARVRAAKDKPIASLFELPKAKGTSMLGKMKTELLFIERCLDLLKPGGRLGIVLPEGVFNNPSLAYVREFCEDRAYVRAVVSLPQETFTSSGASVKASLLFMQKFTKEQQADFNDCKTAAGKETRGRYTDEIAKRTAKLEKAIEEAKKTKDPDRRKALQSELHQYERDMEEKIQTEARALLKERFSYQIFLYEAEHIGITATGETDKVPNELFPNPHMPSGIEKTAIEWGIQFTRDPSSLPHWSSRTIGAKPFPAAFWTGFVDLFRWDPDSFCKIDWKWPSRHLKPIRMLLQPRKEKVDRKKHSFAHLQPITIHFDGSMDKRKVEVGREYSMDLFFAREGDLVVSKIDLKNGAVGIVPNDWPNAIVTNHFAVYEVDRSQVLPLWIHRIVQQPDFKEYLWRNKVGAEGRKEVKIGFFESVLIPVPTLETQGEILAERDLIKARIVRLEEMLSRSETHLTEMIHGRTAPRQKDDIIRAIQEAIVERETQ